MAWVFEARSRPQPFGKVMRTPSIVFTGYRAAKYPAALDAYRGEVAGWLAEQGVRV